MKNLIDALRFAVWAGLGGTVASLLRSLMMMYQTSLPDALKAPITDAAIAFGLIGACVGATLLVGYSQYLKQGFQWTHSITTGGVIGLVAGAIGGAIAGFLFNSFPGTELLHVAVWGITGTLLGAGLSLRVATLNRLNGLLGGAAGGLVGGACSAWLTVAVEMPELLSRLCAFAAVGFFIGLSLFLVAAVMRSPSAVARAAPTAQPAARPASGFALLLSNGKTLSLADGIKLSASDIPGLQASAGSAVAEVARNPNDPNVLGLKNLSRVSWNVTLGNQNQVQVAPGRNVRIAAGTEISFGSVDGVIQ